jgi:phosphopantothenate---cysteine ligase (ATP)
MSAEGEGSKFSAESYYATQPPPPSLDHDVSLVREFVSRQAKEGRNVVLVTVSALISVYFVL